MTGSYYIRPATDHDMSAVLALRERIEADLQTRGIDQWHNTREHGHAAISEWIQRGTLCVVFDGATDALAGTIGLDGPDMDFWTESEAKDAALYIYKLMIDPAQRGTTLGDALLNWASGVARDRGCRSLRLDCNRTNTGLHRYWTDRGFRHLATREAQPRQSGALFERPAHINTHAVVAVINRTGAAVAPEPFDRYDPDGSAAMWIKAAGVVADMKQPGWDDWNAALDQAARELERHGLEVRQGRGGLYYRELSGS